MNCFGCGDEGHMQRDCPNTAFVADPDNGSAWCGICDERTRLILVRDDLAGRCQECHPLRHQHLRQHRRCPSCKMIVHEWDTEPCGRHSSPVAKDRRPPIEDIREITRRPA